MTLFLYGGLILLVYGFSLFHMVVGLMGIEHEIGLVWAILAFIVAVTFRFTLPITIGAYFGAIHLFGWPWGYALLFAAPGLLLMIPGAIYTLFEALSVFRRAS